MDISTALLVILFFVIGGGIITGIAMYLQVKKHRPLKMATDADLYVVMEETQFSRVEDSLLRTHTTRTKVSSSNSGGSKT